MDNINALGLYEEILKTKSCLCVRLDFEKDKIPQKFFKQGEPLFSFNKHIVDRTHKYTVAYKLNPAFYLEFGEKGLTWLIKTVHYIKRNYPGKLVILDLKFGDFAFRSEKYAKSIFEEMKADAVTLSPYIGGEALEPFFNYPGKRGVLMALTPNTEGALDFQLTGADFLWESVISKAVRWKSTNVDNLIFVVADGFEEARKIAPCHFFLVPNIKTDVETGKGSIAEIVKRGANDVVGLILDYAHDDDFYKKPATLAHSFQMETARALHEKKFFKPLKK